MQTSERKMATEGGSFIQPTTPKFDGHYDHWGMLAYREFSPIKEILAFGGDMDCHNNRWS